MIAPIQTEWIKYASILGRAKDMLLSSLFYFLGYAQMKNNHLYTTKDVVKKVGITRPTLYKWFKDGKVPEAMRDRNNFRLFFKRDIDKIVAYKNMKKEPKPNDFNSSRKIEK